jgi:DNA modification methylase
MSDFRRPPRPKRALSHVGGETLVAGDPKLAELLAHALDVGGVDRDRLTHGFHSYPARMHWATAERVLTGLELSGAHVLDPFCGSGTVLVEARVQGCRGTGTDLNPLAVELTRLKTNPLDGGLRMDLVHTATLVRTRSEERVQARDPVRAKLPPSELAWYEVHVVKEMAGLLEEINKVESLPVRAALRLVFSSIVVKFSRQRSDTAESAVERRVRKGLVSEFFERKATELASRLEALEHVARGPLTQVREGDARRLPDLVQGPVDVVLTSPPYGGTYDYVNHHARRFAWLGIDATNFQAGEIGARRRGMTADRFARELSFALKAIGQVLRRDGLLVMLMGDGQHEEERVPADSLVAELAEDLGFEPLALATQTRPDFQGGSQRGEHLMALRRR